MKLYVVNSLRVKPRGISLVSSWKAVALLPRPVVLDFTRDDEQGHKNQDADGSDETGVGIDGARDTVPTEDTANEANDGVNTVEARLRFVVRHTSPPVVNVL